MISDEGVISGDTVSAKKPSIHVTVNEDMLDKEIMGGAVCLRQSSFRECSLTCLGCVHKMPQVRFKQV